MTRGQRVALAGLTGVAAALAFPPWGLHALVAIALVPLLLAVRGAPKAGALALGWLAGSVGIALAFSWVLPTVREFHGVSLASAAAAFAVFSLYHGAQLGLFAVLAHRADLGRWTAPLWTASAWVAVEYLMPRLFPWSWASPLAGVPVLLQGAELGGVWVVSFLVVWLNATAAAAFDRWPSSRSGALMHVVIAAGAVVLVCGLGWWRMATINREAADRISVFLVQANVTPGEPDRGSDMESLAVHRQMSAGAAAAGAEMVIWPESTLRIDFARDEFFRTAVEDAADRLGMAFVLGAHERAGDGRRFNSLFAVAPETGVASPYRKRRLLPFAEQSVLGSPGGISPGHSARNLAVAGRLFAPSICYEAIFAGTFNDGVARGAEVLLNVTDDSWFGPRASPEQHFQATIVRSIETRRSLVRASNSGISAVVAPTGEVVARTSLFERTTLAADVPTRSDLTPYVRFGAWLPAICLLAVGGRALFLAFAGHAGRRTGEEDAVRGRGGGSTFNRDERG